MQLSRIQFEEAIELWLDDGVGASGTADLKAVNPADWSIKRDPVLGHAYLCRLRKVIQLRGGLSPQGRNNDEDAAADQVQEIVDEAQKISIEGVAHMGFVDLHIVYSPSYRVPVLYFRAYTADGSVAPLEDLLRSSLFYRSSETELADLKDGNMQTPSVSQGEHPLTTHPCFFLHPCETAAALAEVMAVTTPCTPHLILKTCIMLISTVVDIR